MVKQQLWIANSTLLLLMLLAYAVQKLIHRSVPRSRGKKIHLVEESPEEITPPTINIEKIYHNDLFDTYSSPTEEAPQKKSLVMPIPQRKAHTKPAPPAEEKPEFMPPLTLTIKGIILSSHEEKSLAMVADKTNKESTYHVGDKIQDAQIIKMTKNKLIVLRSNGQQETYFLRKPENLAKREGKRWEFALEKVSDTNYKIDSAEFVKEIDTLGELVEHLGLSTAYQNNTPIGVRVGRADENTVGALLGLKQNDIITQINGENTGSAKERIAIYDAIQKLKEGDTITLAVKRDGSEIKLIYTLETLRKINKLDFLSAADGKNSSNSDDEDKENELFKLSKSAQRALERRKFQKRHHTVEQQQQARSEIREMLRTNMKQRVVDRRVRS